MQVETGSYVGNGAVGPTQISVSFQPDWVWVNNTFRPLNPTRAPVIRHKNYGATLSNFPGLFTGMLTNAVVALNASGFTVGNSVYANQDTLTYHWLALRDDGAGDLVVGTYLGDGGVTQAITGLGMAPDFVHVQKDNVTSFRDSFWRTDTLGDTPADAGLYRPGNGSAGQYYIESLDADGFTVGELDLVNALNVTYFYIACKKGTAFDTGTYVGDGTDNRIIPRAGTINWLTVKKRVAVTANVSLMFRSEVSGVTDEAFDCGDNLGLADTIQEFTGGGFEIGTHDRVNTNAANYDWWAWGSFPAGSNSAASVLLL